MKNTVAFTKGELLALMFIFSTTAASFVYSFSHFAWTEFWYCTKTGTCYISL